MGVGKGKSRRMQTVSVSAGVKKLPKPKFNMNDKVQAGGPPYSLMGHINAIVYSKEHGTCLYYIYDDSGRGFGPYAEKNIGFIKNVPIPYQLTESLYKTVTYHHRQDKYEREELFPEIVPELKSLDGQKA